MMRILREAFFYALVILFSAAGCDLYSSCRPLLVTLPAHPPAWKEEPPWGVLKGGQGLGAPQGCRPGQVLTLTWPKEEPVILLYYPGDGTRELKPAGLVRAPGTFSQPLELTWEEGWLAESILGALGSLPALPALNWERIRTLYLLESTPGSPWLLDRGRFLKNLTGGNWRPGIFRPEGKTVEIPFPEGDWYAQDPFLPTVEGGQVRTVPVRSGINLWYNRKWMLAVTAGDEGGYDWGLFRTFTDPSEPAM